MHAVDVFMLKNCTTSSPYTRKQPYVYEWSLIFFHKLLFGDIKLFYLEHRNRKLSAHDCTDHIKTLFSSGNYHETRNINTSQAAMLLVPGHNCATLLVPVHKVHNVLTVFQLKTTWRLGNVQLVLIVAVDRSWRLVSLLILLKNINRTKSKTPVGK